MLTRPSVKNPSLNCPNMNTQLSGSLTKSLDKLCEVNKQQSNEQRSSKIINYMTTLRRHLRNKRNPLLVLKTSDSLDEPRHEKPNKVVSEQVQHKPSCTSTEDGYRLEILYLKRRGNVLSM